MHHFALLPDPQPGMSSKDQWTNHFKRMSGFSGEDIYSEVADFYSSLSCSINMSCSTQGCIMSQAGELNPHCDCFQGCQEIGTCCPDFEDVCSPEPHLAVGTEKHHTFQTCEYLPTDKGVYFYIVKECRKPLMIEANETEIELCEGEQNQSLAQHLPYRDPLTKRTYKNIFCASCNGVKIDEMSLLLLLNVILVHCSKEFIQTSRGNIEEATKGELLQRVTEGQCQLSFTVPISRTKQCNPAVIRACNSSLADQLSNFEVTKELCQSYASYVALREGSDQTIFANAHCALCNGVNLEQLSCLDNGTSVDIENSSGDFSLRNYMALKTYVLVLTGSEEILTKYMVAMRHCHNETEVLLIANNTCSNKSCQHGYFQLDSSECIPQNPADFKPMNGTPNIVLRIYFEDYLDQHGRDMLLQHLNIHLKWLMQGCSTNFEYSGESQVINEVILHANFQNKNGMKRFLGYLFSENIEEFESQVSHYTKRKVKAIKIDQDPYAIVLSNYHKLIDNNPEFVFDSMIYDLHENFLYHLDFVKVYLPSHSLILNLEYVQMSISWQKTITGQWQAYHIASAYFKMTNQCIPGELRVQEISGKTSSLMDCQRKQLTQSSDDLLVFKRVLHLGLSGISTIGLVVSIAALRLVSTLRKCYSSNILHIMVALLLGHAFLIISAALVNHPVLCDVMGALRHYVKLSSYFLINGLTIQTIKTLDTQVKKQASQNKPPATIHSMIYGWGIPVLIVAIYQILHEFHVIQYSTNNICWISRGWNLVLSYDLPVALLTLANTCIFCKFSMNTILMNEVALQRPRTDYSYQDFCVCMKLNAIMGFTWAVSLLSNVPQLSAWTFIFDSFQCLNGIILALYFMLSYQ